MSLIRNLWMRITGSLQTKTISLIIVVSSLLLAIFVAYDARLQRQTLEDALIRKGEGLAISGATALGHILQDAIASGRLTEAQVFDTAYQPIPNTNPAKYHTAYDAFTDANFQKVLDAYLEDPEILYAAALDVNGYLPTHNTRFSKPLTGDYKTDLAGNRTKRIFTDDVAVKAAKNTQPTLRQLYPRDTGELVWDISSPIMVNGKHWGVFRVGISLTQMNQVTTAITMRILTGAALLLAALSLMGWFVARSIAAPILLLRDRAMALAEGDLTQEIHLSSRDEVGQLAAALNQMVVTWREIIGRLRDDAVRLSTTAAEVAASSEELSRTTASQSEQISRTASAAEEMATTIREVARNAELAAQASTASSQRAQAGGDLTAETAAGLARADQVMQQLRARSDEIGKIVLLIQDVAAQTNILALNAAIEAAGAGAAGARFDVVAEEIRKLAARTSQATGEIAELIRAVQADTLAAAQAISKGASLAQESGKSLADIVASSASVNDMVQNISAATAEQSLASREIAASIEAMADGSQQTATATRETAQIGIELSNLAERLKQAADRFKVR